MKVAVVLLFTVASALAASTYEPVPILHQEASIEHDGNFHYKFETGDGVYAEQHGEVKTFDKDHTGVIHHGAFKYVADDGQTYSVTYTADETGYHPEGAHLPVAPPVPEAIARSLAYIAAHPVQEVAKRI